MRVLLSWLREFAPLEGTPDDLGQKMSDLGMAVEEMDLLGDLPGIVVAEVLETRPHPSADRIQLVDVDAGDGEGLQVCCGAFNMSPGDLVPLATVGSTMPSGMEITRRKMRGEWSNGMLCSAAELELGGDHGGILILPRGLQLGADVSAELGLAGEVVYDLEINPNRPDAMSMVGVARDLAAGLNEPFSIPEPQVGVSGESSPASVEIVDPDLCGRFVARVLHGVHVGPGPLKRAVRLQLAGMRPINNVVDASNYVMLELGTPNHTYDLALVPDGAIRVRRSRGSESLVTLDDLERKTSVGDGLICDGTDTPIGLAGVMGGASTEIGDSTSSVLLEVAWWDPPSISRTAKRLNLRSEASARFERGVDPEMLAVAADRFAELLAEEGATMSPTDVDTRGDLPMTEPVLLRTSRVEAILGVALNEQQIRAQLEPIGFACTPTDGGHRVEIPSWRPDTAAEIDVIEEVARHYGYDALGRTVPRSPEPGGLTPAQRDRRSLRRILMGQGLDEAMPMAFLAPDTCTRMGIDAETVKLTNPLVAEESVLRPSLLPGLLQTVAYNQSHRNADIALFEIGHTFRRPLPGDTLPDEHEMLAVMVTEADAFVAKGLLDVVAQGLGLEGLHVEAADGLPALHPTRSARVLVDGEEIGVVGELDPSVAADFEVTGRVATFELRLDRLLTYPHGDAPYEPVRRMPSADIDLAFAVDESVPAAEIEATLVEAGGDELVQVELFDVYRGEGLEPGTRSLAYRLRFQAEDRTLTDPELTDARQRCIHAVEGNHAASLRSR